MSVPVIRALVSQYPDLRITVVTRGFFSPFFRGIKNVAIFEVDLKTKYKGVFGLYKLYKELNVLRFDAVADIHNVLRTKILKLFFTGKRVVQIDKGREENPMKRYGTVEEVSNAVTFFSSDLSSYVSGTTLYVDGAGHLGNNRMSLVNIFRKLM